MRKDRTVGHVINIIDNISSSHLFSLDSRVSEYDQRAFQRQVKSCERTRSSRPIILLQAYRQYKIFAVYVAIIID